MRIKEIILESEKTITKKLRLNPNLWASVSTEFVEDFFDESDFELN